MAIMQTQKRVWLLRTAFTLTPYCTFPHLSLSFKFHYFLFILSYASDRNYVRKINTNLGETSKQKKERLWIMHMSITSQVTTLMIMVSCSRQIYLSLNQRTINHKKRARVMGLTLCSFPYPHLSTYQASFHWL